VSAARARACAKGGELRTDAEPAYAASTVKASKKTFATPAHGFGERGK
jgi:hypothetical protein